MEAASEIEVSAAPYVEAPPSRAAAGPQARAAKKRRARIALLSGLLLAGAFAVTQYLRGLAWESTDNAQVEGHIVNVATRISGQIARVLVRDNQAVREGDLLIELDPRDLDAKLAQARAELAQAEAGVANSRSQRELVARLVLANLEQANGEVSSTSHSSEASSAALGRSEAQLESARAGLDLAEATLRRVRVLFNDGALSAAEVDNADASERQARAALDHAAADVDSAIAAQRGSRGTMQSARGRLSAAEAGPAQLAAAAAALASAEAMRERAQAAQRMAELNRAYAEIRAPMRGVVSRVTAEPGQWVSPERALFALVNDGELWVVANYKEDQLGRMRTGQAAEVEIDTFSGITFHGRIDSLSPASGSRFALLPPDNSSGNFVKVVQRVPVRVKLDDPGAHVLRPGMSAYVRAHVSRRGSEP